MTEEYEDKEIDLAMSYLRGEINEIQLNYLSVQSQIDVDRVKRAAEKLMLQVNWVKKIGLIVALVIIGFSIKWIWF